MKYKNPTKLHISTPAAPTTLANSNAFKHFLTESWFSHYAANRLDLPPCSCPWDPSEQTPPPPSRWLWFVLCPSSISTSPILFGVGGGGEGRKTEGKGGKRCTKHAWWERWEAVLIRHSGACLTPSPVYTQPLAAHTAGTSRRVTSGAGSPQPKTATSGHDTVVTPNFSEFL